MSAPARSMRASQRQRVRRKLLNKLKRLRETRKLWQRRRGMRIIRTAATPFTGSPLRMVTKHDSPRVFHLCEDVSPLRDKNVVSGTVAEAYKQNAKRITKQLSMEQNQCGFEVSE